MEIDKKKLRTLNELACKIELAQSREELARVKKVKVHLEASFAIQEINKNQTRIMQELEEEAERYKVQGMEIKKQYKKNVDGICKKLSLKMDTLKYDSETGEIFQPIFDESAIDKNW